MILDGKKLRDKKMAELKNKILELNETICLLVIQVGEDPASTIYIKQKEKAASSLGYKFIHTSFPKDIQEDELIYFIQEFNQKNYIDGIIVQMPLPEHINATKVQNAIDPNKDVDGLTNINAGKLLHNEECIIPCTPKGIIDLLDEYKIDISGKSATIVGRSMLVGKPLAALLTNRDASVSLLHSKTSDLKPYTKNADILVSAVGKKHFITKDMVKKGSTIIDVGINRVDDKLYGDVDFDNVKDIVENITPVPGGVGPMTVYELMNNTYEAHILRKKK